MTTYFWTFAIVPVQSYISEARRSRDLLAGSTILSYLCLKLLRHIQAGGGRILIPYSASNDYLQAFSSEPRITDLLSRTNPDYSIPNRATGYITGEEPAIAKLLGELPLVLGKEFKGIFGELQNGRHLLGESGKTKWRDEAWSHLQKDFKWDDFDHCPLQLVWAASPSSIPENHSEWEDSLPNNVRDVDTLFESIKMTRPLTRWQGAPVAKCTLCTKREVIAPKKWTDARDIWNRWAKTPWVHKGYLFSKVERLCSLCLARRALGYCRKDPFPSTNEIAAKPWLAGASQRLEAKEALFATLKKVDKDIDCWPSLFRQAQSTTFLKSLELDEADQTTVQDALRSYAQAPKKAAEGPTAHEGGNWPSDYLAVLVFDGDDMGEKVSNSPRKIPQSIDGFARSLGDGIIENNHAKYFYLGGDEGLILAPIETSLKLARGIRQRFSSNLPADVTLSMGLCLFDRERPLGLAIEKAHWAVEFTKKMPRKNGLTVAVQTASGNVWSVRAPWGPVWKWVQDSIGWIREGKLSHGWAYGVQRLFESIGVDSIASESDLETVADEIGRLSGRRLGMHWRSHNPPEERRSQTMEFMDQVRSRLGDIKYRSRPRDPDEDENPDFAALFHLIAFMARQGVS